MSPEIFWITVYLGCLMVVGYGLIVWLGLGRSSLETFGLAACLGPSLMGAWLILGSLLGYVPSRCTIFALAGAAVVSILFRRIRFPNEICKPSQNDRPAILWMTLPIIAVACGICFIGHDALLVPTIDWDAFVTWQLKAKVLYHFPLIPRPSYFSNLNLSYSHLRYPPLVAIISSGAMAMISSQSTGLEKSAAVLLYLGLGAILFAAIRRMRTLPIACGVTAIFMSLPMVLALGGGGSAEMSLVTLYACSLICLLRWQERDNISDLVLTALFSVAMAWSKNEGLALAIINGLVLLLFTPAPFTARHMGSTAAYAAIVASLYAAWPLYTRGLPRTDEDYASHLTAIAIVNNLHRVPHILNRFLAEMINLRHYAIFWPLLALMQVINYRTLRSRAVVTLWAALLLQIAAITVAYLVVTLWSLDKLIGVSLDRMVLHLTPAAALLIALQWPAYRTPVETQSNP